MVFWKNFVIILVQRKTKTQEATGRQQKCDTISGRISCLAPNSRANNIENIEDALHLCFANDIMDKIVDWTDTRVNETIACLQRSENFN